MSTAIEKHLSAAVYQFSTEDWKGEGRDIRSWSFLAKVYIYQLTGNENFKVDSAFISEQFKSNFTNLVEAIDNTDIEIYSIINTRHVIDFLFSKQDSELKLRIGAKKYNHENQLDYEKRITISLNKIKLEFDSCQNIKLSNLVSTILKKRGVIRNFIGRSHSDIAFGKEQEFSFYLKYKLAEILEDEKILVEKFQIDDPLLRITSEIYRILLIAINNEQSGLYGVKISAGGVRQKKQLINYLSDSSIRIKKIGYIYAAHTKLDGKWYVGQTIGDPEKRFWEHRKNKTGPYRTGAEEVTWHILESDISGNDLNNREAFWIKEKNAYEIGHNRTKGNS